MLSLIFLLLFFLQVPIVSSFNNLKLSINSLLFHEIKFSNQKNNRNAIKINKIFVSDSIIFGTLMCLILAKNYAFILAEQILDNTFLLFHCYLLKYNKNFNGRFFVMETKYQITIKKTLMVLWK